MAESTLRARRRESGEPPESGEHACALPLRELTEAFTTYGADLDLACGTLRQCAEELQVLLQAKQSGCSAALIDSVLLGIAQRIEVAAKLASEESAW